MTIWNSARNSRTNPRGKNVRECSQLQADLNGLGHVRRSIFLKTLGSADAVNVFVEAESVSRVAGKRACVTSCLSDLGLSLKVVWWKSMLDKRRDSSRVRRPYAGCLPLRRNDIINRIEKNSDYHNIKSIYVFQRSPRKSMNFTDINR